MDDTNNVPASAADKGSKTGPKPKTLKEATFKGREVGRGENKKIIDPEEVQKLASIGMKNSEIAEWFGIDDSTLGYNFKQELLKGKLNLNQSLRRAQIKLALSGNATMLIWLGRNILGQSENPFNSEANEPLPWTDDE
jgi:hypothetical protein